MSKAIICGAINGVLTDPKQHNVPVTPAEMAQEARRAYDAGASIIHFHLRQQGEGKGHLPSWDIDLSREVQTAIREACPGIILNHTTGVVGPNYQEALDCVTATEPEMAACNAGSLNYLKARSDGQWAWPPMLFDNRVEKVQEFCDVILAANSIPEFECFDTGIVRSIEMYRRTGMFTGVPQINLVMGVASGMPLTPELLPILIDLMPDDARWQVTAIGRSEVWATHQKTADLGGMLRVGLEDTFYLPNGDKVSSNGPLVEQMATCAHNAGRDVASPSEARAILGL